MAHLEHLASTGTPAPTFASGLRRSNRWQGRFSRRFAWPLVYRLRTALCPMQDEPETRGPTYRRCREFAASMDFAKRATTGSPEGGALPCRTRSVAPIGRLLTTGHPVRNMRIRAGMADSRRKCRQAQKDLMP